MLRRSARAPFVRSEWQSAPNSVGTKHLGVLDGLRGLAILWVMWFHIWELTFLPAPDRLEFLPETGFVGVLLFFFLSGFVISLPFVRSSVAKQSPPSWRHFAWRRFLKIVPSYVLSIALLYILGYAQVQPGASVGPDLLTHLLFIHTWFQERYGTINGVLWSLAVEVEFYCIFPLVWALFKKQPWLTAAAMIVISWAWRAYLAHCCYNTLFPSYEQNLPGFLDVFAFGMLSAYTYVRFGGERIAEAGGHIQYVAIALGGVAALVILLESLWGQRAVDQWDAVWQIDKRPLIAASFGFIAVASLLSPRWWQRLLDNVVLRFFAAISYNLYLYHQVLARELLTWHVPSYRGNPHDDPGWQVRFTYLAFAVNTMWASFITFLFERELLRWRPSLGGSTRGLLFYFRNNWP
jgi:peptidoglycan/LPS O-acetylase OafA/YrhL